MGLFDSFKKFCEGLGKELEKGVNSEVIKNMKDSISNAGINLTDDKIKVKAKHKNKELPEEFGDFPKFRDTVPSYSTRKTVGYKRVTMDFSNVQEQEVDDYITEIYSLGYEKGSNVRYDKGNTYIIVDYKDGYLNLVFHIKK